MEEEESSTSSFARKMSGSESSIETSPICRLCGASSHYKFAVTAYQAQLDIFECPNCAFQFQDIPAKSAYGFYDEAYYKGSAAYAYLDERKDEEASRQVWKVRARKLIKRDKSQADEQGQRNFLDVGCAFGGLMKVVNEQGYQSWGVEVSEYSGAWAAERFGKERLFLGNIEVLSLPANTFSLVSMIEVIEHVLDARAALINIRQSMKAGAVFLLQTANMAGLQAVQAGASYHYYLPGHLSYFNRTNLSALLLECGFSHVKFVGGVEFGLLAKLKKSARSFKRLRDYAAWFRISLYHFKSKLALGKTQLTSSMVLIAEA